LPVNKKGIVDLKKLKESLDEKTVLVSIMYANNEIGAIQPIDEIANIIHNFRNSKSQAPNYKQIQNSNKSIQQYNNSTIYPLFHTDAVQAIQFLDCNVNNLGVDMMTLSAHKIYGPKGVGILYVSTKHEARNSKQIINSNNKIQKGEFSDFGFRISDLPAVSPLVTGGGQEFGLRSGTENVAGIIGMAKAIELVDKNREKESKRIEELKSYFIKELKKIYPKAEINGITNYELRIDKKEKSVIRNTELPNIINVFFPDNKSEDLLIKLDLAGVAVSSGSACTSFAAKPSHVLAAMGFNEKRIKSSLRFSFGKFTTKDEIKSVLKILKVILR
jgi:cysteine desulfurase